MAMTSEMTVLVYILTFVLVSMLADGVQAMLCYMGQEPDPLSHKVYRWVIPVPDPCQCTEVRVGGVSTSSPWRPFNVTYYDDFLHSNDTAKIRQFLNCTVVGMFSCGVPLGMEDGSIPDESISASSRFILRENAPNNCQACNGRLNYPGNGSEVGGWCPLLTDWSNPWLQVDLGKLVPVEGVIIQGMVDPMQQFNAYVTAYQVQYSHDESTWAYVTSEIPGYEAQTFTGNTDQTTPVTSMFDTPIQARYIRILPTALYPYWPAMRIELIGCKKI